MKRIILTVLAGLVGVGTAASLVVDGAAEESGRLVEAVPVPAAPRQPPAIAVRHIRGRQYLSAYRDIAGVWTICDGITRGVRPGDVETEEGCFRRIEEEMAIHARGVLAATPNLAVPARTQQLKAAVLLAYNIGVGAYGGSTTARRFNAGDWRGGCDAMLRWNKARVRGRLVVVRGLQLRRARERRACLAGL